MPDMEFSKGDPCPECGAERVAMNFAPTFDDTGSVGLLIEVACHECEFTDSTHAGGSDA